MRRLLLLLLLAGCTGDPKDVRRILEADGCADTVVGGYALFACGEHDAFSNRFACDKNGHHVTGVVCSGLLKGHTIRYD